MEKVMDVLGFDDADLAANRLGTLTQKQKDLLAERAKSHKSFNKAIGVVIALMFGGALLPILFVPIIAALGGSYLEKGAITIETVVASLPFICMGLVLFVVFGGIFMVVLRVVSERANRKVDTVVRRAEGKVNFVWVERQERNTSSTGSYYKTVRVLEMRIGGETFNVQQELPNVIDQDEEWIFYYTNHPFKFLSAEKLG
ncbi:MAG: hypothetical protein OHK003_28780 [Anaerolineales bacterium]